MPEFNPEFFASLIVSLGAVLWIINQIRRLLGKEEPPQPFTIQQAMEYCPMVVAQEMKDEMLGGLSEVSSKVDKVDEARRESVSRVYEFARQSVDRQRRETKEDIEKLRKETNEGIKGVHDRTNDILVAVSRLEGPKNDRT